MYDTIDNPRSTILQHDRTDTAWLRSTKLFINLLMLETSRYYNYKCVCGIRRQSLSFLLGKKLTSGSLGCQLCHRRTRPRLARGSHHTLPKYLTESWVSMFTETGVKQRNTSTTNPEAPEIVSERQAPVILQRSRQYCCKSQHSGNNHHFRAKPRH